MTPLSIVVYECDILFFIRERQNAHYGSEIIFKLSLNYLIFRVTAIYELNFNLKLCVLSEKRDF